MLKTDCCIGKAVTAQQAAKPRSRNRVTTRIEADNASWAEVNSWQDHVRFLPLMTHVIVTKRGADRVRNGHLWIYRSDVVDIAGATGGSVVSVHDPRGNFVGQAFFSAASEIALRLLAQTKETIDREWWRGRIRKAAARRKGLRSITDAYRLVYSEGDLLPSLIIDVYSDVLVLQTLSQGTEGIKPLLVELLLEEFTPRAIVERNDVNVRKLEGLALIAGTLYGSVPEELEIVSHGVRFVVTPLRGQKTGAFLDQRENHLIARDVGAGRALDCFTFNGGFALNLAAVCDHVTGLDISGEAIALAQRNAKLNGVHNVEFREANVFDALREMESAGERFDTIVLDPPAFAKNRASVRPAMRG
ncbi:MAG TPA: class I SAM-dependent rRNA methyltransferase, partial [Pyrinomonadaceae bacterium]|nr:class I SAM-dependent rRNA methyltransferase [Pyrinomonadaceae bacterium]